MKSIRVSRQCILVILGLWLVACGGEEPQPAPSPTTAPPTNTAAPLIESATEPPPTPEVEVTAVVEIQPTAAGNTPQLNNTFDQDGITLAYSSVIASAIDPVIVQGENLGPEGPYWATYPTFRELNFEGYTLQETFHRPRIEIYSVADYSSINLVARDTIQQLDQFLQQRPGEINTIDLPFLPIFNAGKVLQAQTDYVDFTNGRGVRYLTMFAQAVYPISNFELFYTFQGLTNDGQYYVLAVLPIKSPTLPDKAEEPADYDAFSANFTTYIEEIVAQLNAQPPGAFTPTLDTLDAIIASLKVNPEPLDGDANGQNPTTLVIDQPIDGSQFLLGDLVTVRGYVPPDSAASVSVTMRVGAHTLATADAPVDSATGAWETTLTVPVSVIGAGQISATTATESAVAHFQLYPTDTEGIQLSLDRPIQGEALVEGTPMFLEGRAQDPINNTITVGLLINNCTEFVARQTINLEGGRWNAFVILPPNIQGAGCVVVYTGEYGLGNWREVQQPVTIYLRDDPAAPRITIANPYDETFAKGSTAVLYGIAINPPDGRVNVTLVNPDTNETIAEGSAAPDTFGYWQFPIFIPQDAPDFAIVTAGFTEDGQEHVAQTSITLN